MNQSKHDVITCSRRKARENECERVTIVFVFTSDWIKKWREFFKPIVRSVISAKPITFRKTALLACELLGHLKEIR